MGLFQFCPVESQLLQDDPTVPYHCMYVHSLTKGGVLSPNPIQVEGVTKGKKSESLVSVLHTYLVFRLGRWFDLSETKQYVCPSRSPELAIHLFNSPEKIIHQFALCGAYCGFINGSWYIAPKLCMGYNPIPA